MEIKRGIPVSPGVAIGPALMLDTEAFLLPQRQVERDQTEAEVQRLRRALAAAVAGARAQQQAITDKLGKQYGAIFGAHALLMDDPAMAREMESLIREQRHAAEYAVSRVIRRYAKVLESIDHSPLAARAADLFDIERSILGNLLGQRREQLRDLKEPVIILAHDLTPSETAALDPRTVHAFATEAGGRASHTAIMAGVLEIPAVVGLGKFVTDVSGGDLVIVDGTRGVVILNPDPETLERYERTRRSFRTFESELEGLRDLRAETRDGVRIPTEEDHLDAYLTVLKTLGPDQPVIIRTLDLGADKFAGHAETAAEERNPSLGTRSVRLCLRNLTLFKTQMRAILRASAFGNVQIMFPMVSTLLELRQCKMILAEVKEDLEEEGIACNRRLPVGTMIEVPSAAILADLMAREVDFFSIGTNDLTQYTLAADRTNQDVAALYNAGDPAVVRLIDQVVRAAGPHDVGVTVCGEMGGDPTYTMLLLGLGVRQLSVTPHNIPEIKKVIRSITLDEAAAVAREALRLETARDVNHFLRDKTRRILPEVFN
jgi:phosphotransferase system enzyme I (PtsI)